MEETMRSHRIPDTDSIEELARFWDTHDLTDFEDQLQEVSSPVFVSEKENPIAIVLTPREARTLKELARAEGVKEATLAREWVREKLRKKSSFRRPPNKPLQPTAQKTRRS